MYDSSRSEPGCILWSQPPLRDSSLGNIHREPSSESGNCMCVGATAGNRQTPARNSGQLEEGGFCTACNEEWNSETAWPSVTFLAEKFLEQMVCFSSFNLRGKNATTGWRVVPLSGRRLRKNRPCRLSSIVQHFLMSTGLTFLWLVHIPQHWDGERNISTVMCKTRA